MKPTIHTDNYEAYLLDYLEGNLNAEEVAAVEAFLAEHEDIAAEVAEMKLYYLAPEAEEIVFTRKSSLYKKAPGGRVVPFWQQRSWQAMMAAAILIGLVVFVWMQQPSSPRPDAPLQQLANRPQVEVKVDSTAQQPDPSQPDSAAGKSTPLPQYAPVIDQPRVGQQEHMAQVERMAVPKAMQKHDIAEISLDKLPFEEKAIANYAPVQPAEWPPIEETEAPGNLWQAFLRSPVVQAFVPTSMEDQLPPPMEESLANNNTIVIEVPRKGKELIDKILNR